jgi:hypothetical protein
MTNALKRPPSDCIVASIHHWRQPLAKPAITALSDLDLGEMEEAVVGDLE